MASALLRVIIPGIHEVWKMTRSFTVGRDQIVKWSRHCRPSSSPLIDGCVFTVLFCLLTNAPAFLCFSLHLCIIKFPYTEQHG